MLKKIIKILENDARTDIKQIATMVGSTAVQVAGVMSQAEEDRIILKYKTMINWDKLGDERVWALIEVKMVPQRDVGFDAIAERIYRFPQARTVYLVSGTYDLAVLVMADSMHEIADFVTQKLAPIEGVQGTVTHFLLKRYKEDGEILEEKKGTKRQPLVL
jgi:DNA-binding Lrp family transcriptional regulator